VLVLPSKRPLVKRRVRPLRVAIYSPAGLPESFRVCVENLAPALEQADCDVALFDLPENVPGSADVIWDPRAGGGNPPLAALCRHKIPLVVTVHGVAPMALPLNQYFPDRYSQLKGFLANIAKRRAWRRLAGGYAAIVAVSEYGKRNIESLLKVPERRVFCCPNGVDTRVFVPAIQKVQGGRYFLHISNDEPRKNIDRIVEAYRGIEASERPPLLLKLPSHTKRTATDGISIIRERLTENELVRLYQDALAFVFPSLYEGFGLPILEAMGCGCPVITSYSTACGEVAGPAAIKVDPGNVAEIRAAMEKIARCDGTRTRLRTQGLTRARAFSWAASGRCYRQVFMLAANQWPR
jgi:glycosyltransferase involved in cell wall biosynthesis